MGALSGRSALVTGVGRRRGIGFAIASRLLRDGAGVLISHYGAHDAAQPWGADDPQQVLAALREHCLDDTQQVQGMGELVGVPDTNTDQCEKDLAAGRHWDASFSCPASRYLGSVTGSTVLALFEKNRIAFRDELLINSQVRALSLSLFILVRSRIGYLFFR